METPPRPQDTQEFYISIFGMELASTEEAASDNVFVVGDIQEVVDRINENSHAKILQAIVKVGKDSVAVGEAPNGLPFIIIQHGNSRLSNGLP